MHEDIRDIENSELPEVAGIYMLFNEKEDVFYLGAATDIRARVASHRSILLYKKHTNKMLQDVFDNHNLYVKILVLLPHVSKKELKRQELIFKEALGNLLGIEFINRKRSN